MPIGEIVKRIFNTDYANAAKMIQRTWLDTLETNEKEEQEKAQRLVDWYSRDNEQIREYMIEHAKRTFSKDVSTKWHFPTINAVPRTIKRLSQAYREAPERELVGADGNVIPRSNKKVYDQLRRLYEPIDVDSRLKDCDRYATLLNTMHLEVVPRGKGIDWDVRLRPKVTILPHPDNYLDFAKFAHSWSAIDPDDENLTLKKGWVYWTEDEHYLLREDRVAIGMSSKDLKNPYKNADGDGVIPIVTVRKIESDGYWGRFGADLVTAVELANLQLANLYEVGLVQTHGIPILINLKQPSGSTIKLGMRNPISADDVSKEDVEPTIKFAHPDPDIKEMMDFCDWLIKEVGATYGLPASAWALEEKRMSGYAKYLDNLELLEAREDEVTVWERIEADLFNKSRIVYNTWASKWGQKPIDPKLTLKVTFPKTRFPESPKERAERLIAEFTAGISSPVEHFMNEEGLTEEEALKKAIKIAKQNSQIRSAGGAAGLAAALGADVRDLPPELQGDGEDDDDDDAKKKKKSDKEGAE